MKNRFELLRDITTPTEYIRAGEIRTGEEWEKSFPGCMTDPTFSTWFLDMSKFSPEEVRPDLASQIIDEVFKDEGLQSVTYKLAARKILTEYIKREYKRSTPPLPTHPNISESDK